MVDHARRRGNEVIWVLHEEPGSGTVFDPVNGQVRVVDEFRPDPAEMIIHKSSHNAFTTTNLGQHLTANGVRRLRIAGIRTEQCCETTARLAGDLGYTVDFVLDATATHPLQLPTGGELTSDDVMERTAAVLAGRFATITSVDEVVSDGLIGTGN